MNIQEVLSQKFSFSMEVFPPKKEGDVKELFQVIKDLKILNPDFISVTYGAGGSTQSMTREIASEIKNKIGIESMAHLTCVGNTKEEISAIINDLRESNIKNILALRGDPPAGMKEFQVKQGGFAYASELVDFIRQNQNHFSIGVAGYPEKHPEAGSLEKDIENLKKKIDAGADFIVTQLFFENEAFNRFMDKIEKAGIRIPVLPGIFLVSGYNQLKRITELSNAEIPKKFHDNLLKYQDKPEDLKKIGIEHALMQSEDLIKSKRIGGLHFYIMNRKDMILPIYEELKGFF
ncbi:MAG TPA: methylenetetrahydrofolate reductase [NAD(P)H] [Spirochaetia bacterium]|nr:MAG: methylenetetrahydrofolate reductase [NAD(P)H] [Spirochaetes bacterium GWB1_36_13]HCL55519.1 methylenetetrahydrofolate reductase [NAD(P)H] [Spirochaetia bacterium]